MDEGEFLRQLLRLLETEVIGLEAQPKLEVMRAVLTSAEQHGSLPACQIVPFITGRRPVDEAAYPGLGSSDNTAMILPAAADNHAYLLYHLSGLEPYPGNLAP